jgi:alanine racemase
LVRQAFSRKADGLIGGIRHPLIAAVTANDIYIGSHQNDIVPGEEIVLYGKPGKEEIPLEEIAELSERSEYNLLPGSIRPCPAFI